MARLERFKHIISGGWWWDEVTKRYVQAGKHITRDFDSKRFLQSHLGWTPDRQQSPGNRIGRSALTLTHSPLVLGSITHVPNNKQPGDCAWDSLFSGLPPVRPSGVGGETRFRLGETMISRSGDVCSEGSWVFYNTHNVRSTIVVRNPHLFTYCFRPSPLRALDASPGLLQAKKMRRHRSSFSSHGKYPHRETATMGCRFSIVTATTPTLLSHRRSASLTFEFSEPHDWQTRTSTLFSMHSTTAKAEDANSSKQMFFKIVRRHRGQN